MLTNDLSNNKIPAPPPPPPPGLKNTYKHNDKDGKSPSVTAEKSSSGSKLKRDLPEVSNPNFLEELKNRIKHRKEEEKENNASDKTKNDRSNIKQPNRISTTKPVSPRVLSPQQDNGNSNKPSSNSGTNNSTQSEKGLSENPIQLATEQKIDTPILINTLVGISKTAALKYSIATLLLCISSVTAGIYTYLSISVTLSDPVLFTVIASISALVMFSSAAYLINSFVSAINSEKGVDPGRKQPQNLQKAKGLEHSNSANTPTSSLPVISGTPSAPPPPPPPTLMPVKPNTEPRVTRKSSLSDTNQKDVQQKQSDTPVDARSNLLAKIRQPRTLKKIPDKQKKNYLPKDSLKIPQKQEEESVAEKRENGVQTLNQNQSQNSDSQAAKKLEHSNSDTTTGPIRKVESQKTDKEPSNSESMQQGDYMNEGLKSKVLERRKEMYCQDEQLDSLDEQDYSLDSFGGLLTEPNKMFNQEQKHYVHTLNASKALQNIISSENPLLNSPSNNLLSNSSNVSDDEEWETQPQSIPYCNLDKTPQERRQEKEKKKESDDFFTTTKVSDVNSEMQYPSTLSIKEHIALFDQK